MIDNRTLGRARIGSVIELAVSLGLLLATIFVIQQVGPTAAETLREFGRILSDGLACVGGAAGGCL